MNEEIETQVLNNIDELLGFIKTGAQQAGDFVAEQTPLLVQEILKFNLYENLIYLFFIYSIFTLLFYLTFIREYKWEYVENKKTKNRKNKIWGEVFEDGSDNAFGVGMGLTFPIVISTIVLLCNIPIIIESVKIVIAPRLYLIEYISELIK